MMMMKMYRENEKRKEEIVMTNRMENVFFSSSIFSIVSREIINQINFNNNNNFDNYKCLKSLQKLFLFHGFRKNIIQMNSSLFRFTV